MWLRGQQWQLGKDAKSTEGPASSSFERCTRILVTVLILAIVCVCAGQQLARFGGQPRRAVYKSFHGPQRSTEEINGEVKRQELMLSTKDTWNPKAARAAVQVRLPAVDKQHTVGLYALTSMVDRRHPPSFTIPEGFAV